MNLIEVVRLDSTSPAVIADALAFVKATKKTPVLCKDTPGFVVNRLLVPYMAQAFKLVEDGVADFKDVDVAMRLGAGHPMGPLYVSEMPPSHARRRAASGAARLSHSPLCPPLVRTPLHSTLADYVGLDTTCSILKNWTSLYPGEPAFFVPSLLEAKVKEGKLGRKSGEGFYRWKGNTPILE